MNRLACELDRSSSIPIYEQLYIYIKKEIVSGRLPYQTKLPSKRITRIICKLARIRLMRLINNW